MSSIVQLRKDTLENWLKYDPVLADGEEVLVATDSAKPTEYNARKVGNGTAKFSALPMLGYDCLQETGKSTLQPMSQNATTEAISQGFDTSFKGRITSEITTDEEKVPTDAAVKKGLINSALGYFVQRNYLANVAGGTASLMASNNWDCAMILIDGNASTLEIEAEDAVIYGGMRVFFKEVNPIGENYIGTRYNNEIPSGAKLCIINFKKSDNPNGFEKLFVRQIPKAYALPLTQEVTEDSTTIPSNAAVSKELDAVKNELNKISVSCSETVSTKLDESLFEEQTFYSYVGNKISKKSHNNMNCYWYDVNPGSLYHIYGAIRTTGYSHKYWIFIDENNVILDSDPVEGYLPLDIELTAPIGAVKLIVNTIARGTVTVDEIKSGELINIENEFKELQGSITNIEEKIAELGGKDNPTVNNSKSLKIHLYGTKTANNASIFYIRTKYNSSKDIILVYYTNLNSIVSPSAVYVGDNSLEDSSLMTSTYMIHAPNDSTAPLFDASLYWHLFAQHGLTLPVISNTINLTSNDIGAVWKDQLNREYSIGNVTAAQITLIPKWIDKGDYNSRDWSGSMIGTAITSLTHVSGGVVNTAISSVAGYGQTQIRPIMESKNRKFILDGQELTKAGDYYGEDFQVSETQIGYDPSTITKYFPTDFTGAKEMAVFTWSYNFKGASCCVNTTIEIKRKVECESYGACQQQFFVDNGEYKAMFVIPKVKPQNGVTLDKPFNSGSTSSPGFSFKRNEDCLYDVNEPYDRQIGYLYNPTTKDYLIGLAAGLSLVSGDTVKEKRCKNIPISTENNGHNRLGSFSPSNANKFYIAAVNTAPFKEDNYMFPVGYFKEINYYVSYFDPSENKGQVYWYKDGNSYVIYMHCQEVAKNEAINLPDFMEGLGVELIEKTENAELFTQRITNGKLFVNWNSTDGNYIVLKTV